jgi:hypothetical protein
MRPVLLEWIRIGTRHAHVSEFSNLPVGRRPHVFCPVCDSEVTMRLGDDVRDHVAHRPGSICSLTAPETARHLNAKLHIARELESIHHIDLQHLCGEGCGESVEISSAWTAPWDSARPETRVDTLRPDVVLFAGGKAVAAIEVAETHPVPKEKVEHLAKLGLPWVEVKASDIIGSNGPLWSANAPLPILRRSSLHGRTCSSCLATKRTPSTVLAGGNVLAGASYSDSGLDSPRSWSPHIIAYRAIDYYYPSGKRFRDIYYITQCWERAILNRAGSDYPLYTQYGFPPRHEKAEFLAAFKQECEYIKERRRASRLDCPMPWTRIPVLTFDDMYIDDHEVGPDYLYDKERFPPRYFWDRKVAKWRLIHGMKDIQWPVNAI